MPTTPVESCFYMILSVLDEFTDLFIDCCFLAYYVISVRYPEDETCVFSNGAGVIALLVCYDDWALNCEVYIFI